MPRRPQSIPDLKLHKHTGTWYVILDGTRHYLGKDKDRADEQRRRLVAEQLLRGPAGATSLEIPAGGLCIAQVLAACGQEAERVYSHGQLGRVRQALLAVGELYGSQPADQFGAVELDAVRTWLVSRQSRRGKPPAPGQADTRPLLSRNYVNSLVGVIQTLWAWAATKGLVPEDKAVAVQSVVGKIRKKRGGREVPRVMAVAAPIVDATLPHCNHVVRAMVQLQRLTGMRPGEVCRMRRGDVSTTPGERLTTTDGQVVHALEVDGVLVWVYVPHQHKTEDKDRPRIVAIGRRAQELLRPFLDRLAGAYLFSPRESEEARLVAMRTARKTPVQPSQQRRRKPRRSRPLGERYVTNSYYRSVGAAISAANKAGIAVPHWFPNQLRHYAGTEITQAIDQHAAQAVLGHSTPDTTAGYVDGLLRKAAAVAAQLG